MANATPLIKDTDELIAAMRNFIAAPANQRRRVVINNKIKVAAMLGGIVSVVVDGKHYSIGYERITGGVNAVKFRQNGLWGPWV